MSVRRTNRFQKRYCLVYLLWTLRSWQGWSLLWGFHSWQGYRELSLQYPKLEKRIWLKYASRWRTLRRSTQLKAPANADTHGSICSHLDIHFRPTSCPDCETNKLTTKLVNNCATLVKNLARQYRQFQLPHIGLKYKVLYL